MTNMILARMMRQHYGRIFFERDFVEFYKSTDFFLISYDYIFYIFHQDSCMLFQTWILLHQELIQVYV